jgi:hypothetical protein
MMKSIVPEQYLDGWRIDHLIPSLLKLKLTREGPGN